MKSDIKLGVRNCLTPICRQVGTFGITVAPKNVTIGDLLISHSTDKVGILKRNKSSRGGPM